jgi:hypothetical protein
MSPPSKSPDFEFYASGTGYLHVKCLNCQSENPHWEYVGLDPTMAQIKTICSNCGNTRVWKLFGACLEFPPKLTPREAEKLRYKLGAKHLREIDRAEAKRRKKG